MNDVLVFPRADREMKAAGNAFRKSTYRMLWRGDDGLVCFASVVRTLPFDNVVAELDRALKQEARLFPSIESRLDSLGAEATLLDLPFDLADGWCAGTTILNQTVLQEVLRLSREGIKVSSEDSRAIERQIIKALQHDISVFVSSLDATVVVPALRIFGNLRPSVYNYLFASGNAEWSRNRLQAAELYPAMVSSLMGEAPHHPLQAAIDHALPLLDVAAEYFGVPKSCVRALKGVTSDMLGSWTTRLGAVLLSLAEIAPEKRPKANKDWVSFIGLLDLISQTTKQPVTTTKGRLLLVSASRNGFSISEDELALLKPQARCVERVRHHIGTLVQWIRKSSNELSRDPEAAAQVEEQVWNEFFCQGVGVVRMCSLAERWEMVHAAAVARFSEADNALWLGYRWPALRSDLPLATGGLEFVPLVDRDSLLAEGEAMEHCCGDSRYQMRCAQGLCQIFSLRSERGARVATLEMTVSNDAKPLVEIRQLRAPKNGKPTAECKAAAKTFVAMLNDPTKGYMLSDYLQWRQTIGRQSLTSRKKYAAEIEPIIQATEKVFKKVSYDALSSRVIELSLLSQNLSANNHSV
ncbi:PcfJ domain-containing protein [Propionivibrio dicarboxylicus]|uniref:PcfJ-like protein n=1 Tax=Propionivibrio dicarboxylicus TaxID=83767 RepID=A0A1G8NL20_9RHOO|nr:PcfJ domain-containing protein [Propionivibrio dicarboxylicus]SDI80706.1 PcfJ-like protein [Propionivibrio dicarboxylicus]